MTKKLTKPQAKALWAAFAHNNALNTRTGRMGGANRRMVERMAADNLLNDNPPFPITLKGMRALESHLRAVWARDGRVSDLADLTRVEDALKPFSATVTA
jgi:hypothetical protein